MTFGSGGVAGLVFYVVLPRHAASLSHLLGRSLPSSRFETSLADRTREHAETEVDVKGHGLDARRISLGRGSFFGYLPSVRLHGSLTISGAS